MCELCALTCTFDPSRHNSSTSLSEAMRIIETIDASDDRSTDYSIDPGDTFAGRISYLGDRDWVAVTLEAGSTYDISVDALFSGGGTLGDSYLRIYDANGLLVALDDDGGPGFDSETSFFATNSGTYFISVGAYADGRLGSYTVEVDYSASLPAPAGTLNDLANYLTDGFWTDVSLRQRSFDVSSDNQITVDITDLNADGQRLARWAFDAWELVADIEFVEVRSEADINFTDSDNGAYSFSDTSGTRIESSTVNVSTGWLSFFGTSISSYSFATYIHEIGHALGLGHQGAYNGSASIEDANFANDSWQLSVMSYFSQAQNPTTNASDAAIVSAMMADIVAIQNLYGAADRTSATGGDTIWGQGTNLENYLGDILENGSNRPVAFTIYDAGGTDTLDLTQYSDDSRLDLNDQGFSDVAGLVGNIGIARGTMIEHAKVGSGDDTVQGNELNNQIAGGSGDDSLIGAAGNDRLRGQAGSDTVLGGNGSDTLAGQSGDDWLIGGNGNDVAYGGHGNDLLNGDSGNDDLSGQLGNDILYGGRGHDKLFGNSGRDTLSGGEGADTLDGGQGRDSLDSGAGNDDVFGLDGRDFLAGGDGRDILDGGAQGDVLSGQKGHDKLFGGKGADTLSGGSGRDTLTGGAQADVFAFNANLAEGNDVVKDFQQGLDIIEITGAGFQDLRITDLDIGQRVSWDLGSVQVRGDVDLGVDDFLFN